MDGWGDQSELATSDALLLGFVPDGDLAPLYAAATIFAYPSEREGFGLPVLEAFAQGTAVVTSRGTSTEEVAGGAAELVDPFDVGSIVEGLQRALGDAVALGERGRERAGEMSWSTAAARTADVYRELVR
jgi:alpha-1,3-rhamnosyl/mannosyltransferase